MKHNSHRKLLIAWCTLNALPLVYEPSASAQHFDVLVQDVGGRLTTGTGDPNSGAGALGTRTFLGRFNSTYAVDDPGFNSIGDGAGTIPASADALPGNADLSWDFLPMKVDGYASNLMYWSGVGATGDDVAFGPPPGPAYSLTLFGKNFARASANGTEHLVPGQVLDTTASNGFIHRHRFFFLDNDADPNNATVAAQGVYLISVRLRMLELNRSEPLYFVWGTPEASAQTVQAAFNWVESNEDELAPSFDGDFDGDLDVDGSDFLTWQRGLGTANALQIDGDADGSYSIDGGDLSVWRDEFGSSLATFAGAHSSVGWVASVPEPATVSLATLGAGCVIGATQPARRRWLTRHATPLASPRRV